MRPARPPAPPPRGLVKGEDAGGFRWFLHGRAVHAGAGLELRLTGDCWREVRIEFTGAARDPVLYLPVGGDWETWRPPAGMKEGDQYEVDCPTCNGVPQCRGARCADCDGRGKHWREVVRPRPAAIRLEGPEILRVHLRWPS